MERKNVNLTAIMDKRRCLFKTFIDPITIAFDFDFNNQT